MECIYERKLVLEVEKREELLKKLLEDKKKNMIEKKNLFE